MATPHDVVVTVGAPRMLRMRARFERALAPRTCEAFAARLPFRAQLVQARWSGEAAWVPLGDLALDLPLENATSHPSKGEILFHPRGASGASEAELLVPYGSTRFASKVGQLAGSHFLTIVEGLELLPEVGRLVLWEGAQPFAIEAVE